MTTRTDRLDGMRVLVVGGTHGIGLAVGRLAASVGGRVVVAGRRPVQLDGIASIPLDLCDATSCAAGVERAVGCLGGLDALVISAAITPLGGIGDSDSEVWTRVLQTNVIGPALVTSAALDQLCRSRGRAIFLSSDSMLRPFPGLVPYVTSKSALDTFARGLANECPEVAVTRVMVGPTSETDLDKGWDDAQRQRWLAVWAEGSYHHPATQTPDEAAAVIVGVLANTAPPGEAIAMATLPDSDGS